MVLITSSGITDVGRKRKGNEDEYLIDDALGLYIVADGMGGHKAGEVASRMVVEIVQDYIKRVNDRDVNETLIVSDDTLSGNANSLLSGILLANRSVHDVSKSDRNYKGMGSTVSAIHLVEDTIIAANVGDSPIYLVRNDSIELLSVLHTVMAEHAALHGNNAPALGPEFRHMLTRGMGISETVKPDIIEMQIFQDDVFIICSDGLSDKISPEEIQDIAINHQPDAACRIFVDLANDRGGDDNITVIVLKIKTGKMPSNRLWRFVFEAFYAIKRKIDSFSNN